jgi:hypothetical protein
VIAWQTLAPLIPATLIALVVGIGLARAPGSTATSQSSYCSNSGCRDVEVTLAVPIPFAQLALLGGVALVMMLVVMGVGLLFLRMSTDLDELRAS